VTPAWMPVLLLAVACATWPPGSALVGSRLRRLAGGPGAGPASRPDARAPATALRRRWLLAAGAGLATGLLLGGALGMAVAITVPVGVERLLRRAASGDDATARAALVRDLPVACDLLAVCLAAGLPVPGALAAVAEAVPAPLGPRLRTVAALHRLGAEPRRAWADAPAELGGLGRALVRAGESGAAAVPALHALASESRAAARAGAEAAAQRAGVWVLAPLGACFLPAFVCLGVVPLVLGIAGDVFG
jgi:pilus assembly protein TadC